MLVENHNDDVVSFMFGGVELVGEFIDEREGVLSIRNPLGLITDQNGNLMFMEYMLSQVPDSIIKFPVTQLAIIDSGMSEPITQLYKTTIDNMHKQFSVVQKPSLMV